jgi:hypothetical protein
MAKSSYSYEKRGRELEKKKKKEAKRRKKLGITDEESEEKVPEATKSEEATTPVIEKS